MFVAYIIFIVVDDQFLVDEDNEKDRTDSQYFFKRFKPQDALGTPRLLGARF